MYYSVLLHHKLVFKMNKTLLLIFALFALSFSLAAQNFSLTYPATFYSGPPTQLLEAPITVTNTSGVNLNLLVSRKTNNLAAGHDSYFCWSINCYSPSTSISTDTLALAPGAEDHSFKGYLSPSLGTTGTSVVEYCVFDYNTPTDSICVTFTYLLDSALSVGDLHADKVFSMPYPNPSSKYVMFSYDIEKNTNGVIQIHNVLGSLVKEVKLSEKRAITVVPVSELKAGVYFSSLIADGKKLVTRRVIVSHK